jgi:nitrite reductase/ring-hydroxylating ferredoxin subunit
MGSARIATVEEVPADGSLLFRVRPTDGSVDAATDVGGASENAATTEREAILVRLNGQVHAWLNYCKHFTHVTLDKGSGVERRNGELVCTNHGAYFESDTGLCTHGPCEGAYLDAVGVAVRDGDVYLADDDYEFVGRGPTVDDGDDLSSTSNLEF